MYSKLLSRIYNTTTKKLLFYLFWYILCRPTQWRRNQFVNPLRLLLILNFCFFFLLSVLLKCCHQPCLWAEPWKEEMNQIIKKMEMFPLLHSFVFDFFFFFNTPQMFSGTLLNVGRRQSRYFPETKESKVVT